MRVVDTTTGAEVTTGADLRHAVTGQRWRFSHVTHHPKYGHRIHATRTHRKLGRIPGEFHPSVFGLEVVVRVGWKRHVINVAHVTISKLDDWMLAGVIALVPLAFFEQFHAAEKITELFGFGGH